MDRLGKLERGQEVGRGRGWGRARRERERMRRAGLKADGVHLLRGWEGQPSEGSGRREEGRALPPGDQA